MNFFYHTRWFDVCCHGYSYCLSKKSSDVVAALIADTVKVLVAKILKFRGFSIGYNYE